jgi:histidyl-tRNA synthetase
VLMGIARALGIGDKIIAFTVAIDKLDKIGIDGVKTELIGNGFTQEQADNAAEIIRFTGDNAATLNYLKTILGDEEGKKGIEELESIFSYLQAVNFDFTKLKIDLTLARGLNYYTGAIFEVTANDVAMGSIGGGGRYVDLTGIFGLKGVSGVGISFGADRIYDVMEKLNLFTTQQEAFTQLLFCGMNDEAIIFAMPLAAKARQAGINTEIYPSAAKLKKQLDFANANQIPYAVIIGESEMQSGLLSIKNLTTGEQQNLTIEAIIALLNN